MHVSATHIYKIQACEMHALGDACLRRYTSTKCTLLRYKTHIPEMHPSEIHAHEVHIYKFHTDEMHVYEMHAYETHAYEMYAL
jgi:hypothetical protein